MSLQAPVDLSRPLPGELIMGSRVLGYVRYPVYSWPWFWRRCATLGGALAVIATLLALGMMATGAAPARAALDGGYFLLGALLMVACGPGLAAWVRHRRLSQRAERVLVVIALLLGTAASALADRWASAALAENTPAPEDTGAAGLLLALAIYGSLGGWLALGRYLREGRDLAAAASRRELATLETRQRELDARLSLLQAQIEPHFLFNTLASLRSLVEREPTAAVRLLDALVEYLRAIIPRLRDGGAQLDSTLGQQVELCRAYLEVMAVRMGPRLRTHLAVEPELLHASFPPLVLMTLVENAIKHGLEPQRAGGTIEIAAERQGERLRVSVSDDGAGLRGELGSGIGLANLQQWLHSRYGARASFSLCGGAAGGAKALVEIPYEKAHA